MVITLQDSFCILIGMIIGSVVIILLLLLLERILKKGGRNKTIMGPAIMFINFSNNTLNKKGENIMEGNAKVDQLGLLVFDGPKDKYGNITTLNGDGVFSSSKESLATFSKAAQEQIDAYNNDPETKEEDKIPADLFPYVGAFKTNGEVGAVLLELEGDPTTADDDTKIRSSFTLHIGAGAASSFGSVKMLGVKNDDDEN